jgi:hypothetical protein
MTVSTSSATTWVNWGNSLDNTRNGADTTISPANVGSLVPVITFSAAKDVSATPVVTSDGFVIFPDW